MAGKKPESARQEVMRLISEMSDKQMHIFDVSKAATPISAGQAECPPVCPCGPLCALLWPKTSVCPLSSVKASVSHL